MRAYSVAGEEALRARHLLKDWADEGYLTEAQHRRMEQETVCDFRRINIFLRIVLFFFTLIIVAATTGLLMTAFVRSTDRDGGVFLLVCAAACYCATEAAVSQSRLYRYGIEEALAVCSVGLLCAGMMELFGGFFHSSTTKGAEGFLAASGAIASLWIWHRFGLAYTFFAGMIFSGWLATQWTKSISEQHLSVAAVFVAGLIIVLAIRARYRMTYLNRHYSIAEALLWAGIYVAVNLQISSLDQHGSHSTIGFPRPFYWGTWALTWCLPPLILTLGIRRKDRLVIAVGAITAVVTLATNKPYLGWERHTWDPMLLGVLLMGVALFIRRRLDGAQDGVFHGFTARRLSGRDKQLLNAGTAVLGVMTPQPIPTQNAEMHFGGGDSGGGGASSDF